MDGLKKLRTLFEAKLKGNVYANSNQKASRFVALKIPTDFTNDRKNSYNSFNSHRKNSYRKKSRSKSKSRLKKRYSRDSVERARRNYA